MSAVKGLFVRIRNRVAIRRICLMSFCYFLNLVGVAQRFRVRRRISIKAPLPSSADAVYWGDFYFAESLKKALEKLGYEVRIDRLNAWYRLYHWRDGMNIVLRGLNEFKPYSKDQINLMWNISHPDLVSEKEMAGFDKVFIASKVWVKELRQKYPELEGRLVELLQCTDPQIMVNSSNKHGSRVVPEVVFIGNSRNVLRDIVRDAIALGIDFKVYGTLWEKIIPEKYRGGTFIANQDLPKFYSTAKIVMNDHWKDMREKGFVSNRIFDVLAAGGFVLSDYVNGVDQIFPELAVYKTPEELKKQTEFFLTHPTERQSLIEKLRKVVLMCHTFDNRAAKILQEIDSLPKKDS